MFSTGFTSFTVLLLFSLSITTSSFCTVFHTASSSIDKVLSIIPSANFAFGNVKVHQKVWLTYFGATVRPSELQYNFSISYDLTQIANFPKQILDSDSNTPAILQPYHLFYNVFPFIGKLTIIMLLQFPIQLGNFAASFEFYLWVLVGTDVYIPHCKHRASVIHADSLQLFVMLPQLIEINSFVCNDKINLMSKGKFRQASNYGCLFLAKMYFYIQ